MTAVMYSVIMVLFALNGALQDCKELFLTSKKKRTNDFSSALFSSVFQIVTATVQGREQSDILSLL